MIFVDTSAFLAIENRLDAHHSRALSLRDSWLKKGQTLVTSDYVLDESYTIIRLRAGHPVAIQFGEAIRHSQILRIIYVTPEIIEEAWRLFKAYGDHDFSFTDCTSFSLMDRLSIPAAFTFNSHFKEYGRFRVNPK
jgi:predicted nucleic acid-binding protein